MADELRGYQRSVYAFYSAKGRLPGDVKGVGVMGDGAFDGTVKIEGFDDFNPNAAQAPFVELYQEGIIDFKPTQSDSYPKSKSFGGTYKLAGNAVTLTADIPLKVVESLEKTLDNGDYSTGRLVAGCGEDNDLVEAWAGSGLSNVECKNSGNYSCGCDCYCPVNKDIPCIYGGGGDYPGTYCTYYCAAGKQQGGSASKDNCISVTYDIGF